MQIPCYPWNIHAILMGKPNVGALLDLGEESYRHLMGMAPRLQEMEGSACSKLENNMDLHLEVREQTAYTTLIHLTHYFPAHPDHLPDPDTVLRVYHDAGQVEVLDLRQSALPLDRDPNAPTLEQKWRIGLFIVKWLAFCQRQGHYFAGCDDSRRCGDTEVTFSC
ncbi:MAG TPA: DUF1249 domain-containing protein [Chromatiales bacterium]|nr:DUF1249 domain-containing protein [Chromatiales bacterium]